MSKRLLFLFLFSIITITGLSAQTGGLNLMGAFPQGEFKDNLDRVGYGLSGHFTFWTPDASMPLTLGLNVGYINYGNDSRNTRISSDIPDVRVNVDRSYNIVNFHLLFQISPLSGAVRPYLEALVGGSYLFTETKINSENYTNEVASSTNFDDWAWSYGPGGGMMIRLMEREPQGKEMELTSLWLDIKARYLLGSRAEYLKEGSVIINNGNVSYDVSRSTTDLLTIHLGVVAYF
ncbi:MAG: hypothetical protein ACM3SM_04925 [Bacteroidota bacterium]